MVCLYLAFASQSNMGFAPTGAPAKQSKPSQTLQENCGQIRLSDAGGVFCWGGLDIIYYIQSGIEVLLDKN